MGAVWMIYREDHLKMLSWLFSIKSIDALCAAAAGPLLYCSKQGKDLKYRISLTACSLCLTTGKKGDEWGDEQCGNAHPSLLRGRIPAP